MFTPSQKVPRIGLTLAFSVSLAIQPQANADATRHAEDDAFAAEVAAMLPAAAALPPPPPPLPTERITLGDWSGIIAWTPHIPVSAAALPDGRVLTFASNQRTTFPSGVEFTYAATWNPATGQFVEYNHPTHDMFCGALVMLPDGRVLVNGGRNTTVRSSIFDWRVNTWTRTPDMNDPRWYNTSVALPNGRVWTASGSGGSGTAERWDQATGWTRLSGINWNLVTAEPGYINIWHPFLLLAPDGRLIHFGPTDTMHWVSPDGSGSMINTGTVVPGTHYPKEGAWVMYDEGRILVAGGGANTTANPSDDTTGTSTTVAYTVDVRSGTPIVTPAASMAYARQFANVVVLPNGEVMVMGGNTSGLKFNDTGSILTPEIWNPATGQWRVAADSSVPRNYHSLALLLPDGRVLSAGGGLSGNSADHRDGQLYTPAPLWNADGTLATRPVLNTAPATVGVGTKFTVTGTTGLQKFSFIKMSAITHSVNTDLRYLSLPFTETATGTYEITAHNSLNVMTPGYWMLFGLNAAGTYSVAKTILVDAINAVSIAAPGNQSSYASQSASLQMIASAPAGATLTWSATGLPDGLLMNPSNGLISGAATVEGTFPVRVNVTDGNTLDFEDFTWSVQPATFSQNFNDFAGASGLTLNGNAALAGAALRLTPNVANQRGSAYLSSPKVIGPDTSLSTRFVFRVHGTADGADGMTFVIQGAGASAIGTGGGGIGYDGLGQSVAVEIDNYTGPGDPNANHLAILSNGSVATHLTTFTPGWDLEDGLPHTLWMEYDGPANILRVYAAQGIVMNRPATPVMTATIDLPATVGNQAWFGFTAGTGGLMNNQDVEAWSLSLNAFALPGSPVLTPPADQLSVVAQPVNFQMQATDPNADLLTWSATGLPSGVSISPTTGLISGTPANPGTHTVNIFVTDGNTSPVSDSFVWTVNDVLSAGPLSGPAVAAGTTVSLNATSSGGLNPVFSWNFGDGTPATGFSSSPATSHLFSHPGRYLVTVTIRDDTGRQVTSSYRQAVYAPVTAGKPSSSSSLLYEIRSGPNARLWVVNPDNDSVTVFDAITRAKLAEVAVGKAPRTLALAPDGRVWVANAEGASLTILQSNYAVADTINLPRGSRPYGIIFAPAGNAAYVALEHGGKLLKLDPTSGATLATLDVGLHVRHLSITADGTKILATRFVTPPLPGEATANPETTVGGVKYGGEVITVDTTGFNITGKVILEHSEEPDTSISARGIPNYLGAAAISPDGLSAWVPSKQDNIKRGTLRNNAVLTHDMAVRAIASRISLPTMTEDLAGRVDFDNAGIPSAAAFDSNGIFVFTALEGSREVAVIDSWNQQEILRFDVGRAPQGVVMAPDGRTLFVHDFMDRTVTVHDLSSLANGNDATPPTPAVLNCVTSEKLSAVVLRGKQLFYDARDNQLALQQYVSCAMCHNDGGEDGRVWDFTQFGEGLRNTITLRGHGGTAQGPVHWTGNFDEVQDFEGQMRNFAGGLGLMNDTDFHATSNPLGAPKAGLSADLDALAAYVGSLTAQGNSPDRNSDGSFTDAALAGQVVFNQQNCVQCHSGAQFTDSALNVFHDVGTIKSTTGSRLGAPLTGLDTPTLLGLWSTAPYLHDGSAATLQDAILAHSGVNISATDLDNLAAFLRQLDDAGTAPPPAVITWSAPAPITYGTALNGTQLNATANVPGTFAYSPGAGERLNAGTHTLSVTFTPSNPGSHSPATATVTINVLRAPLTVTAENKSKVYGATVPQLTATFSGFVNGDDALDLDSPPNLNTSATSPSPVGTYAITASGTSDANYSITHVSGSLAVTRAPLTIRADNKSKTYGAANPALTATYTGFVNGDAPANLDTPVALSTVTASSPVGSYSIIASGASDANYTISHLPGTLTISPAMLTVRADDKSKIEGQPNPTLTASYIGFVNGDSAGSLDSPVSLSTSATTGSPVGAYPITAAGAADANYTITYLDGTLTVTPNNVIPPPWLNRDVGTVGLAGSATHSAGTFTVSGSGADIWNGADGFHFVYQSWTGNGELIARVASVGNTDPWAKAGVMFRETLTAGSRHAMMVITPGNGAAFQRRVTTGGTSTHTAGSAVAAPYWVRIVRNGNVFTGYASANGTTWTQVGSETIALPATVYVGLAVTAHNNAALCAAAFSNVSLTAPLTPPSVAITSPANGAVLAAPANITLNASVTANGNTITRVEFRRNGSLLGQDTTSPYSFAWNSVAAGSYSLVARAIYGSGSTVDSAPINITVQNAIRINFQPASASVYPGYLVDGGSAYGNRGNGYTYGWSGNNTGYTRDRNSSRSADQRYDTLNHLRTATSGNRWEIAVPNGSYQVFIVAGDATAFDSVYRINVEGVLTVSGTPNTSTRWISGTRTVTVTDGRITITNGSGAVNNKLCFIDITPVSGLTGQSLPSVPLDEGTPAIALEWDPVLGALRLHAPAMNGLTIETSHDLKLWSPLNTEAFSGGVILLSPDHSQQFFRAVTE